MAAKTIAATITPRVEFFAAAGGGVRVQVFDTQNSVKYECDIDTDTWAALDTAMDTPSTKYIPKNVGGPNTDGRLTSGGQLPPEIWPGA